VGLNTWRSFLEKICLERKDFHGICLIAKSYSLGSTRWSCSECGKKSHYI